ncbi:NCS1 family transporter [Clostridium sp. Marseille-P2415]|uniref:NCS1 family transporter n=1 Tax=Clostridium sp. Marseille-P2415 TaxID=1805471 RepID=UPI000988422B|nr:NCS1 family transporter [Clostridium sp. Marseille-P2415]
MEESELKTEGKAVDAANKRDGMVPVPMSKRTMKASSYWLVWLGGCVSTANLTLGSDLVSGGLNLVQAIIAIAFGSALCVICMVLNDKLCYTTGIPYVVQLRGAFGFKGTVIPALCRGIPAIVWYGFQSWVGASAINEISKILIGFDSIVVWFIIFQALQIGLSALGFQGIKVINNIGGAIVMIALIYMLITILNMHGDVVTEVVNQEGSWGLPFFGAVTSFIGVNCALLVNIGDSVRQLRPGCGPVKRGSAYAFAMIPAVVFMGVIGLLVTSVTGIANPIVGFAYIMPNKAIVVVTLLCIVCGTLTTNMLNNALPPIYVLVDLLKLSLKKCAVIVGLLAYVTFPWELVKESSAAGLNLFVLISSAVLGPVFAILVVDYYMIKKQNVNLSDYYDPEGSFKGMNPAAIGAMIAGVTVGLVFIDVSWLASILPAGIVYYVLTKYLKKRGEKD